MFRRSIYIFISTTFLCSAVLPVPQARGQNLLELPVPGTMVNLSRAYEPAMIKGLTVHQDNPFLFDFIVDAGQDSLTGDALKKEAERLIKYFMASLAVPEKDVWVNLSPYEKDRIVSDALGQTDMGRDLLAQDYILKQVTASLIYPEKGIGKDFWDRVYQKTQEQYGNVQIPVNTFNKVWIMADRAEVFERNQTAFVVDCHLKVMLEADYLAGSNSQRQPRDSSAIQNCPEAGCRPNEPTRVKASQGANPAPREHSAALTQSIMRDIILPELEREVNSGKNFANLRQIFHSLILAGWYKKRLQQALLNQVYSDKANVTGIDLEDKTIKTQIYERYVQAYKKGVFNFIKDDRPDARGNRVPRKYFSGGVDAAMALNPKISTDAAMLIPLSGLWQRLARITAGIRISFISAPPKANVQSAQVLFGSGIIYSIAQVIQVINDTLSHLEKVALPSGVVVMPHVAQDRMVQIRAPYDIRKQSTKVQVLKALVTTMSSGMPSDVVIKEIRVGERVLNGFSNHNATLHMPYSQVGKFIRALQDLKATLLIPRKEVWKYPLLENVTLIPEIIYFDLGRNADTEALYLQDRIEVNSDGRLQLIPEGLMEHLDKLIREVLQEGALQDTNRGPTVEIFVPMTGMRHALARVIASYRRWEIRIAVDELDDTKARLIIPKKNIAKVHAWLIDLRKSIVEKRMGKVSADEAMMAVEVRTPQVDQALIVHIDRLAAQKRVFLQELSKAGIDVDSLRVLADGFVVDRYLEGYYFDRELRALILERIPGLSAEQLDVIMARAIAARLELERIKRMFEALGRDGRFKTFLPQIGVLIEVESYVQLTVRLTDGENIPLRDTIARSLASREGLTVPLAQDMLDMAWREYHSDQAQVAAERPEGEAYGGIDLNADGMDWKITKDGAGVVMNVDPAMIARFKKEGIQSLTPQILNVTPVVSIWPLIGMEEPRDQDIHV